MLILRTFSVYSSVIKLNQRTYVAVRRMSNSNMKFQWGLTTSDPEQSPVLFVGQAVHLNALSWDEVKCKLEPRVTEEAWKRGLSCVTSVPGEACELWPRAASVAALPAKASRHAAPSRAHQLAKIVREALSKGTEDVVLVCRKRDVLASSVAVARSAPLYSARSATAPLSPAPPAPRAPTVQIILAKEAKPAGDCESEEDDEEDIGPRAATLNNMSLSDEEMATIHDLAEGTRLAARITDMPCNIMGVDQFIEEAVAVASALGIPPPTVIRGAELEARGFGGIAGVGRAAGSEPALVSLSWSVPNARASVAWVGKGIVYDTGGLSIKGRTSMVGMKGDCGGAAAVLGAFLVAARATPTYNLHAVLCLAENAVGPLATRPDDVHTLYSGRTVEINNTDAEGRLVLSDGVVYAARDLKATTIVDIATLTGAQGTATGKYHAALVCNRSALESSARRAGRRAGELAHALPFAPELHFPEFRSTVADMKNSVADRGNAQPSCAALFILSHLGFEWQGDWLHIDMASPAHCGERATGYGVALLNVLFGAHTRSKLLQAVSPSHVIEL